MSALEYQTQEIVSIMVKWNDPADIFCSISAIIKKSDQLFFNSFKLCAVYRQFLGHILIKRIL